MLHLVPDWLVAFVVIAAALAWIEAAQERTDDADPDVRDRLNRRLDEQEYARHVLPQ